MITYVVTTAVNMRGASYRYELEGSVDEVRGLVEAAREAGLLLEVPPLEEDDERFFVNPEHIVAIYPKKEG